MVVRQATPQEVAKLCRILFALRVLGKQHEQAELLEADSEKGRWMRKVFCLHPFFSLLIY